MILFNIKKTFVSEKNNYYVFGHISCFIVTGILQQTCTLKSQKARPHPLNDVRVQYECYPTMGFLYMLRKRAC